MHNTTRPKSGRTSFHRDGSVTLWNCLTQTWVKIDGYDRQVASVLATCSREEERRITWHMSGHTAPVTQAGLTRLADLMARGGVVPASEWTNGSGRYVSKRTLPPFAVEIAANDATYLRGEIGKRARKLLADRFRVTRLVVVTDIRAARAALAGR